MDAQTTPELLTERAKAPALDPVLGLPFKVLDDGFIRVVDYMGSDESIVQAARVSYGKGTKKVSDDRALIRYLLRHAHTTPFEMCELKLHVRVPMDCWRQWIRHRTASVNEYSTRYSEAIDSAQKTSPEQWRVQSASNRQGSGDMMNPIVGAELTASEAELLRVTRELYMKRIEMGVAREQARKDLPLSTYTEAYWKCDLHNLLHFLRLRMDSHAQFEIREYARTIGEQIVSRWCPLAWEAFMDYRVESMYLTRMDKEIIAFVAKGDKAGAIAAAAAHGFVEADGTPRNSRERGELEKKLEQLGLNVPWSLEKPAVAA